jgi:hypothetical protein
MSEKKAAEFVLEEWLKLKLSLELELFKQCCEQNQKRKVIML